MAMSVYADTSVFVSVYLPDRHSEEATRFLEEGHKLWLTPLHRAEWAHAVSQHVFRGDLSQSEAQKVYGEFESDRQSGLWLVGELKPVVFEICFDLARHFVPMMGGRTLDSIHVASAMELRAEGFRTFDERQARIARAVGLNVL